MNTQPKQRNGKENPYSRMKGAIIASAVFHVGVVLALMIGIPYIRPETKMPESISVELATVADVTQANKPPVKAPEPKEKKDEPPTKKEVKTPPKPAQSVPKEPEPPKPDPKQEEKKPETVEKETPEQDELAPPKKDAKKPDKKPDQKKEDKKQPDKKPPEKKTDDKNFNSLLKNLTKTEPEQKTDITDITKKLTEAQPSPETPNIGAELTISDIDALRQQLSSCWNVMAGAADADTIAVDIHVIVNQDRTVKEASVMDQSRYNSDDRFRAIADSALRAVRDPKCSPLILPPDKFTLWHDMVINFDPKEML